MEAFRTQARDVTEAPLPRVAVLGIDETRRGRTRWERDADTDKWRLTRDRWHTGFVDALGHGGLLGQVEGRTVADVLAWLATTDLDWRKGIGCVAIDMSAAYRAAIRIGVPHATIVVDHFHVVQLANKMLSMVRRRTTAETRGRRGRASDPEEVVVDADVPCIPVGLDGEAVTLPTPVRAGSFPGRYRYGFPAIGRAPRPPGGRRAGAPSDGWPRLSGERFTAVMPG